MEWVENCYIDGVTIVGVPFGGLKGIEIKDHGDMTKKPNLCHSYAIDFYE